MYYSLFIVLEVLKVSIDEDNDSDNDNDKGTEYCIYLSAKLLLGICLKINELHQILWLTVG